MAIMDREKIEQLKLKAQITRLARYSSILFYLYAVLSFFFWILNLFELDWLYLFTILFIIPYKIVHIFYNGQNSTIDFTLVLVAIISAILGIIVYFGCLYGSKYLENLAAQEEKKFREKQKKLLEKKRKKKVVLPQEEKRLAITQQQQQQQQAQQMQVLQEKPKLVFLISPYIEKIANSPDEMELTFQELEICKQRVNKKIIENILNTKPIQKAYYRKNIFLIYQDFYYVDEFLHYFKSVLDSMIAEFREQQLLVSFAYVMSSLQDMQDLEKELDCMDTILSLGFMDEAIVTKRFKEKYDKRELGRYSVSLIGEYNLSKNLAISNRQPLFALVSKKVKEKKNANENNSHGK